MTTSNQTSDDFLNYLPTEGRARKEAKLPDPREFATRTYSPKVSLRKGVTAAVESVLADFDGVVAAEAMNYGEDELDVNVWAVFQHMSQGQKALNVLNELRSVAAELEETLMADAAAHLKMAREPKSTRPAEVQVVE
jgi:hypothetical protein